MRSVARRAACLAVLLFAAGRPALEAQEYVGPTKCFGCHKLARKAWQDSHAQTLAQLSEPKAAEYAKATGGNAKHPKCLACHAPVPLAAGPAPVSCETCHGPGKGWIVPHQELAFYSQPPAQWKGLRNLQMNSKEIARICVECHVLNDKAIAAAGHPVGAAFDAGRAIAGPRMIHWPSGTVNDTRVRGYDKAFYAAISREGAPIVASRSAGVGGARPPPVVAARPAAATMASRGSAAPPPAASDDEYADLGDDEFVESVKARPIERLALPDPPTAEFEKPPVRVAPRPPPPPPPVSVSPPPVSTSPKAATPPPPPPPGPRGPAEVRGRAALVLADLIRQKKKLDLPKPAPPAEFAGPDGELLRLQDEVLALALETLRRVP